MKSPQELLRTYWGYEHFRPQQEAIIQSVMSGRDTVALLPTGGGKSLCFQIPGLAMEGLCVVISPLVALMRDQVDQLKTRGIRALHLAGGLKQEQVVTLLDNAIYGKYSFLYMSPERLQQEYVQDAIRKMDVCLIAVDEMHCISQWGNDFRPSYKKIAILRELHPLCPIIGLTATATKDVLEDSIKQLELEDPRIFRQSFFRENLIYDLHYCEDKTYELIRQLRQTDGTAIVYVRSRGATIEVARKLEAAGIRAGAYHGGMPPGDKSQIAKAWQTGELRIIVATNAFGMGIDKSDVRMVFHIQLPDSLESYFQEAGRAGRDGKPAMAMLLWNTYDKELVKKQFVDSLPDKKALVKVYRNLVNYFQIPYGEGEYSSFPFDFGDFCRTYGSSISFTYNALSSLDRLGIIQLSQQFGRKSTVQFKVPSETLLDYFRRRPQLALIGKTLLRIYGGIFDLPTPVSIDLLANKAGTPAGTVVSALEQFASDELAEVEIANTDARITFLVPREDEKAINPHGREIEMLNSQKRERVQAVIDYVENDRVCRSVQLLAYFGESHSQNCGRCSVCRALSANGQKTSVKELEARILSALSTGDLNSRELQDRLQLDPGELVETLRALLDCGRVKLSAINTYQIAE